MPKGRVLALAVGFIFCTGTLFAASSGSLNLPEQGRFSAGLEVDRVYHKDMLPTNPTSTGPINLLSLEIDEINRFNSVVSYGLFKRGALSSGVSLKTGVADLRLVGVERDTQLPLELFYEHGLYTALGTKGRYQLSDSVALAADVQWGYSRLPLERTAFENAPGSLVTGNKRAQLKEFQASLLLQKDFAVGRKTQIKFSPYFGPAFDKTEVRTGFLNFTSIGPVFINQLTNAQTEGRNEEEWGWILGFDLVSLNQALKLNVEFRFVSEEAVTLSLHYNF